MIENILIVIKDEGMGKIQYFSSLPRIELGESIVTEKASSAKGLAMHILNILSLAAKSDGYKESELKTVEFTISDKQNGKVSFVSNPTHKFLLQKELSGHKLSNAESVAVRIMRMLAQYKKEQRETILVY